MTKREAGLEWHKKAAGRHRLTVHRNAWLEVARTPRYWQWAVYGVCFPYPKHIVTLSKPHRTMREAKAWAETCLAKRAAETGGVGERE